MQLQASSGGLGNDLSLGGVAGMAEELLQKTFETQKQTR